MVLDALLGGCASDSGIKQPKVHRRVGFTYVRQMRMSRGLAEFQRGIDLNPKEADVQPCMPVSFLLRGALERQHRVVSAQHGSSAWLRSCESGDVSPPNLITSCQAALRRQMALETIGGSAACRRDSPGRLK